MKIATVLSAHTDPKLVSDTLDSILHYMTDDVLLSVDGISREFDDIEFPVYTMKGFKHGIPRSPYRNVALSLSSLFDIYPKHDWYCYMEYDCLVTSERFKANLKMADEKHVWMLGCDGHIDDHRIPPMETILKQPVKKCYYLLGACQFFSGSFMRRLKEINFFEQFLELTNRYPEGEVPGYNGYDVSEHMYPSLARQFGGNIGVFSTWDAGERKWHGSHEVFPIRWQPEIDFETENFKDASIIHPLKTYTHPLREFHRKVRYESKRQKHSYSA